MKNFPLHVGVLSILFWVTSCQKSAQTEPEEPVRLPEKTLYTLQGGGQGLDITFALSSSTCQVAVSLDPIEQAARNIRRVYGEVNLIEKPLSSARITGIDLITRTDYDSEHPKGSSLNDILELHYIGPDGRYYSRIDLVEYFNVYPTIEINGPFVFRLATQVLPPKENRTKRTDLPGYEAGIYVVDVTLRLTFDDGTELSIDPTPALLI